ncbi:uncharacterized protein LOC128996784 isoform X2 [Macrosteles quadrilineatus]|uniref:uncharacterized protein LOC128996784 isoform X2 n=1 Tax=Macrosteles quadrilineatus TaxID=74068 RepID=UPI0023E0DD45|nr:uncharacterized protein LOC128996784 isoform X2 [Macrosteles quadrilineatus]
MENNNKELYALLEMYNSESGSDNSELVLAPQKKKKLTKHRKRRQNSATRTLTPQVCGGRTVSLTLALSLLLCWLLTLTWLAIALNSQIQHLDSTVQSVVAGSQGVPEALQKCHSMSKQLQQNQTALFIKLNLLTNQLNNFTSQVTTISNSLAKVEQRFKTSPELIKVPHDLETLTTNIATFGSQMQDLEANVVQLKEANSKLSEAAKGLQTNVSTLREEMMNLHVGVAASAPPNVDVQYINTTINSLRANLSLINDTLSKKIQWNQDDQEHQYKQIVSLQERNENVSTRVTSLQNECNTKNTQVTSLSSTVDHLTSQLKKQEEHWTQVSSRVSELSEMCSRAESNYTQLSQQLSSVRSALSNSTTHPETDSTSLSESTVTVSSQGLRES